jgi:hypothetical protein
MRQLFVVLSVCAAMLFAAPSASACYSDIAYLGWDGDLNANLHDFGSIFMDSHPNSGSCGSTAASRLQTKLNNMPDSAFRGFLSGGNVTLAMAAAMQLGPRGLVSKDLDAALARAGRLYVMDLDVTSSGCGFGNGQWVNGNTCQEDRLIGAATYSWVGAYYRKSGRPWEAKKDAAITQIQQAFSAADSVCRHNASLASNGLSGPCNGSSTDPIISINHGAESPAYGIGQITSLSVALIGFDAMAYPWSNTWLNSAQQAVLGAMWTEGSGKANVSTGVFDSSCYDVTNPWNESLRVACNDVHFSPHYEANMFPVWYAFQRYNLPGRSSGGYQWTLSSGSYDLSTRATFFGAARYAYYHILTKSYNDPTEPDPFGWPRPAAFHGGSDYYMGLKANGYWTAAENNGAGAVNANRTSQGPWESFYLNDINGGELNSGDTVSIRTTDGWYWSATNGGGSTLQANQQAAITWEVFTIEKRNGTGRIHDGDTFALKAYNNTNYVVAAVAGAVSGNGNSSTAAVFTFKHVNDY